MPTPKTNRKIPFPLDRHNYLRIYAIDRMIRDGAYPNVTSLAERFELSPRTIERDIESMRDFLGAPLEYSRKRKGYYYTSLDFNLPSLSLTEGELVAVFLWQKVLSHYRGTPFEEVVRQAFMKICLCLQEEVSVDLSFLEHAISFDVELERGEEKVILEIYRQVERALRERQSLSITYYTASRDECTERTVDPYHLRFHAGAWYLIAFCHLRGETRIFALDRVSQAKNTGRAFQVDPSFSLEAYLGDSFSIERGGEPVPVVVRFDAYQARWVRERRWHPSQEIEEMEDGSLVLRLKVAGLGEIKRWVMSFGSHAEVLEPLSLREEIIEEMYRMAGNYIFS